MSHTTGHGTGRDGTLSEVTTIHTLGPTGTNLEKAAHHWFAERGVSGTVLLHPEVEDGLDVMGFDGSEAILACAVYPRLHDLVFRNLHRLEMADSFILDTHDMVLAGRTEEVAIRTIVSHPAPSCLVAGRGTVSLASSNSRAAALCAAGEFDACVTTYRAAQAEGLRVLENFGPVPMVFTLHVGRAAGATSGTV
ncbi:MULTISPECIES: bacilysin biosynthesis protein BacA [unclassified Streptomyces]|uniref:bacilysin biosynthesis protein BacA n=1 Tax=unclassified Streptomyces TaxID=2593676 RepID=UPI00166153B1|nr:MULTISPECIES: bacilysin biosynthesis protein BacA [unclassified Streptomyces]MBD0709055.1 bacilysin biosynthesis protein BacA [Streptomyces sp. CBMA291]MBD0715373.1 bacilysin biosynthesis protein BacA [Streptomyces sp. CBMA370]